MNSREALFVYCLAVVSFVALTTSKAAGGCDERTTESVRAAITKRLERPTIFNVIVDVVSEENLSDLEISRRAEESKELLKRQAEERGLPFSFDSAKFKEDIAKRSKTKRSSIHYARNGSSFHVSAELPSMRTVRIGQPYAESSLSQEARYNGVDLWEIDTQNKAATSKIATGSEVAPMDPLSRESMEEAERNLFDGELFRLIQTATIIECVKQGQKVCVAFDPTGTAFMNINLELDAGAATDWTVESVRVLYQPNEVSGLLYAEVKYGDMIEVDGYQWPKTIVRTSGTLPSSHEGCFCDVAFPGEPTIRNSVSIRHPSPGMPPDPSLFSFEPPAEFTVQRGEGNDSSVVVHDPNLNRLREEIASRKAARKIAMEKSRQDKIQSRLSQAGIPAKLQWGVAIFGILASAAGFIIFWRSRV